MKCRKIVRIVHNSYENSETQVATSFSIIVDLWTVTLPVKLDHHFRSSNISTVSNIIIVQSI